MCNPQSDTWARRWQVFLVLLLMLVSVNSAVLFGGRTLLPIASSPGILLPPYGYQGPLADGLTTLDPWGALNYGYAADVYTAQTFRQGSIPLWNPYQGLGQPFLATGISAVLYPLNWLHLILPLTWWDLVYITNWLLAAVFLSLYLQYVGISQGAALVGGAAICGSGFFQGYLPLRDVLAVAAWWPLLLYGVERAIREPSWRLRHLVLALAVYCTITGGQPEVTFLSLLAVLGYGLTRLAIQRHEAWRSVRAILPGTLAGFLLAAPLWLNFMEYAFSAHSIHQAGSGAGLWHLDFKTFAAYIFPSLYGRIHTAPFGVIEGWVWNWSPGWFPATGMFLAVASLKRVTRQHCWSVGFFWGVAGITGAKIWGLPGSQVIGSLPLLERLIFPRYSAFLLAFSLAALASYGVSALTKFDASAWARWLKVWGILLVVIFAVGLQPLWPAIRSIEVNSPEMLTLATFGGFGAAWAVIGPSGLWWLAHRRPDAPNLLCFLAALSILLQGVASASNGYSVQTHAILSGVCLGVHICAVLILGLVKTIRLRSPLLAAGYLSIALPASGAAVFASQGLAARYNPFFPAPYLRILTSHPDNLHRAYSFDTVLQANFAAPLGITSLNTLEALLPTESAAFMQHHLDRGASPLWFLGNLSAGRNTQFSALSEFWHNKRYFDLVGAKYIITQGYDPSLILYDTDTFGSARVSVPLLQPLELSLVCPTDNLSSIQVMISTYARKNLGTVTLKVLSDDGALLRQQDLDGASLVNNSFQELVFPPIRDQNGQHLRLRLEFAPAQSGSMIAAWIYPDQPSLGFALRVVDRSPLSTFMALLYQDQETGVRVWKNSTAIPRVFLATRGFVVSSWQEALTRLRTTVDLTRQVWIEQEPDLLTSWPETQAGGEVLAFELTPNTVEVQYAAKTAGILTLTDSYAEGWHATLDGHEVPVLRVDGVFRGVRIEGPGTYEVRFWYRPPYWNLSLGMAGFGFLLLIGSSCPSWRNRAIQSVS